MCTAIREFRAEGEKSGSIKTLVDLLKLKLGKLSPNIEIERSTDEQLELLTDSFFDIQSEEDILKIIA